MIVNIDTLEISFNVLSYEANIEKYLDELELRKNERRDRLYSGKDNKSFIEIGDQVFEVIHAGKHGYAYILHNDDMELNIAKYRSTVDDFYPIRVRFKAKLLWEQGRLSYNYVAGFIRDNFGYFDTNKVGRCDLACHVDFINPEVKDWNDFVGRFKADQAIRFNRKLETLYFGSRNTKKCYCRIYDKSKKCLRDKDSEWFFDIWYENGMDITNVWNIEFELKRGMLKELEVETYEDLNSKINSIWLYLTTNWITWRIPESATRRTNMDLRPEWVEVQGAYNDFEFIGFIERYRQRLTDTSKYIPAISGYITSMSAVLNCEDLDQSLAYIKNAVEDYISGKKESTFEELVLDKKKKYVERDIENLDLIVGMTSNIHSATEVKLSSKITSEKNILDIMKDGDYSNEAVASQQRYLNKLVSKLMEMRV